MTDVDKKYLHGIHVVKVYTLTRVALGSHCMFMSKFYLQVKHRSLMFLFSIHKQFIIIYKITTDSLLENY